MYNKKECIPRIIDIYESSVRGVEKKALNDGDRAYGGVIRASKGKLVENFAKWLVKITWTDMGNDINRINVYKKRVKIPIKHDYVENLKKEYLKAYIKKNISDYFYPLAIDWIVEVDEKPIIAIECKAYTENAMLKRVLVDHKMMKEIYPNISSVLFQLESQLGGDYGTKKRDKLGSTSTNTILSHFGIDLNIITLLQGERKVDRPIHKKEFFKELDSDSLDNSIKMFKEIFKIYE